MKILTSLAILGVLGFGAAAQARAHDPEAAYAASRPLVVYAIPPFYGDPYVQILPPGPYQLSSPYHTLCGLTLVTDCAQESSYGP